MESRVVIVVIVFIGFIAGAIGSYDLTKRTIHLSEITPQGILHLTSGSKHVAVADEDNKCAYWVTVSPVGKNYPNNPIGISVAALGLELVDGASIKVIHYEIPSNTTTSSNESEEDKRIERPCDLRHHSGPSYPPNVGSECKHNNTDVCIQLQGNWNGSRADLLLNLYYDDDSQSTCPEETFQCICENKDDDDDEDSSEEDMRTRVVGRCIPHDLTCNGIPNCGVNCAFDESESTCGAFAQQYDNCVWTKFEYLAMMVMTGLLLLLIPIFFLFAIMYHRRRPPTPSPLNGLRPDFDGNNNRTSTVGRYPHVISTVPVNLDAPPRYEDLPEDVKIPMPSPDEQTAGE